MLDIWQITFANVLSLICCGQLKFLSNVFKLGLDALQLFANPLTSILLSI
jgi:hypothetical protein